MFGASALAFGFFTTSVATAPFFTPQHTNAFSIYAHAIGTMGALMTGAMFSLNVVGFSIMPGAIRTLSLSVVHRIAAKPITYIAPLGLTVASIELLDRFSLFGVPPLLLGIGIMITLAYQKARALSLPLWLSR